MWVQMAAGAAHTKIVRSGERRAGVATEDALYGVSVPSSYG